MKWKEFEESDKEYPEKIVEQSVDGFSKATKGLAELKVTELSDLGRMNTKVPGDFIFNVRLTSPFVQDYSLKVLTFGYDVEMNPINFILDEDIHQEIFNETLRHGTYMVSKDGKMFSETLEKVFSSNRFVETVTGLMKIARKNQSNKSHYS